MNRRHYLTLLITTILAWGCTATKLIPEGKKLYVGAELKYLNPEMVHKPRRTAGEIKANIQPQGNKKFLGLFRTRLWIYQRTKDPKTKLDDNGNEVAKKDYGIS